MKRRAKPDELQLSFTEYFDAPRPFTAPQPLEPRPGVLAGFDHEMRQMLSAILKEAPMSRYEVAAKMSELLGDDVSKNMLDAYTADSRETHQISAVRLFALMMATGRFDPLEMQAEMSGRRMLVGEEAIAAEIMTAKRRLMDAETHLKRLEEAAGVRLPSRRRS